MGERPQMLRMGSVEVNDRDLEQKAKEATLLSMIIAQQQQRESDRQHDETYKQAQSFLDAVSDPLSLGDDMSDAEFAAEMAELGASGKSLKRRRPHHRGTKKHRRRHRGTKKHRRRGR